MQAAMQKILYSIFISSMLLISCIKFIYCQNSKLLDYLIYPSIDTLYWDKDFKTLNSNYSKVANQCQSCVLSKIDSSWVKFCINTSIGHVRMDTQLHKVSREMLEGKWEVVSAGEFTIADSLPVDSGYFIRKIKINEEQIHIKGNITFSDRKYISDIQLNKGKVKFRKRYIILENKYLMTKKLIGLCGPTMIGKTENGLLIMDVHSFRKIRSKYAFVFKTIINRVILRKMSQSGTATHSY